MVGFVKPDFLIIGAAKAATTWLQLCLQQQLSVFMPDPEPHYFSRNYHRGDDWYNNFFADAPKDAMLGEKSNSYFEQSEAMQRVRHDLPEAKLILQLRNPIERAYSDYCMLYRRGEVNAHIERYFKPGGRFLEGGRYGHHIDCIDRLFPSEQLLLLIYDDVLQQPAEHLAKVQRFLGLPDLVPIETRIKDRNEAIVPRPMRRMFKGLKPVFVPYRDCAWFKKARNLFAKEPSYPTLTPDLHAWLRDYYANDIDTLARRLGRDLSTWLIVPSFADSGGR